MLYTLFKYLNRVYDLPGSGMFQYITFRGVAAFILAMLIVIYIGKPIIRKLQKLQIGEEIRDLGLEGQLAKKGTPTMGGILILLAILIPILLFARLDNIYILLMIISTVWCGAIGFLDDYIKVFRHKKEGLKGKFKVVGQIGLGIIVGTVMCFSEDIVIRERVTIPAEQHTIALQAADAPQAQAPAEELKSTPQFGEKQMKTTKTTIPFFKENEFDYSWLTFGNQSLAWVVYVLIAIFIVTAVSNAANLTDGIDGLLTGVSMPIVVVLGVLAYLSGHIIYADYLNIMFIPDSGELLVFALAMIGALLGFLWYNAYPAQIFMGDTGSLAIGGIIAVFALCIRKELLLPIMCGIFVVEALSVIIQRRYFAYTKRKYGEGRRVFLMAPIHHHYQKQNIPESKITMRFIIISLLLAAISLITLKIR